MIFLGENDKRTAEQTSLCRQARFSGNCQLLCLIKTQTKCRKNTCFLYNVSRVSAVGKLTRGYRPRRLSVDKFPRILCWISIPLDQTGGINCQNHIPGLEINNAVSIPIACVRKTWLRLYTASFLDHTELREHRKLVSCFTKRHKAKDRKEKTDKNIDEFKQ